MKSLLKGIIVLFCAETAFAGVIVGRGHFTVCVLDAESERPLKGINVHGYFKNYSRGWGIAAKHNVDDDVTDEHGMVSLSGSSEKGLGGYQVRDNPGFYNSGWESIVFKRRLPPVVGMWMPYDIVSTMRIDHVGSPIPLWVARSKNFNIGRERMAFTNDGAVASYDLMKNEWLPPFGNGDVEDIRFTCRRTDYGSEFCYNPYGSSTRFYYRRDVEVCFPGNANGMIEVFTRENCGIKLRAAPESGYKPTYRCWENRERIPGMLPSTKSTYSYDDNRCFYIRIRTKLDDEGNVKSAIYGKIYRGFCLREIPDGCGFNGAVGFFCYLNLTPNDRNLEWDLKNNLCRNTAMLFTQLGP